MKLIRGWRLLVALCMVVSAASVAETQKTEPSVSIAFVGDIMLDETPGKTVKRGHDPFEYFSPLLNSADIRVGNLECVVATTGTSEPDKPYTFRAHPRVLKLLQRHFDALSLANNHSGDYGPGAFGEMLDILERQKISYFGGGRTLAQAHTPLVLERNGLRIALLGYNEFFPRSFEADFDKPGIAWSEDEQVRLDIHTARIRYQADVVIPVMHWGWEHEKLASSRQLQLARLMIDAGADAVVGGHPHVTQNVELYQGKPIIYSLGNFVFDGFSDQDSNTGWLLRMEADRSGVRAWRTFVAHMDSKGTPHPVLQAAGLCWERGQAQATACVNNQH
jgi:poly-gamma-glutamate capsule biosynthesis protein CapA/YwtB (metallophosphatase superfamily)